MKVGARKARARRAPTVEPSALDLGHLALFVGFGVAERIQKELERAGFRGLTFSHGFLFQHLIVEARTVGELAALLGVTQQAASKAVAELERRGYVERVRDERDGRVRRVRLSERGWRSVEASRRARARLSQRWKQRYGASAIAAARRLLTRLLGELGGVEAVRARRVKMPG